MFGMIWLVVLMCVSFLNRLRLIVLLVYDLMCVGLSDLILVGICCVRFCCGVSVMLDGMVMVWVMGVVRVSVVSMVDMVCKDFIVVVLRRCVW